MNQNLIAFLRRTSAVASHRPQLEANLEAGIQRFIRQYRMNPLAETELWNRLSSRPAWVHKRECALAWGDDPETMAGPSLANDDSAMLFIASGWKFRDIQNGRLAKASDAKYAILTKNGKRSARRIGNTLFKKRSALHRGKPAYPYRALVEHYASVLSELSGKKPLFSRSVVETDDANRIDKSGSPQGPWFDLLLSAIELALFISGPPPRETVASILKELMRKGQGKGRRIR